MTLTADANICIIDNLVGHKSFSMYLLILMYVYLRLVIALARYNSGSDSPLQDV